MTIKREEYGTSKITTHYFETYPEYVEDIFYARTSSKGDNGEDVKKIIVYYQEYDGDVEYKRETISVETFPDLVHIVRLKHEYCVVCIYTVW